MKKRTTGWRARQQSQKQLQAVLRLAGVSLIIGLLLLSSLPQLLQNTSLPSAAVTPTATNPAAPQFPTVPSGGTSVAMIGTYFHPSGLFSLPQITGWEKPVDGAEETVMPRNDSTISRVGTTFNNPNAVSVIHALVESDSKRVIVNLDDLASYYDSTNLKGAWEKYNGGWKELNRRIEGNLYVINFELSHDSLTYSARQITRLDNGWMVVLRLVVPNNNSSLLDRLQAALTPGYQLWTQSLSVPLDWATIADSGYMVRYPPAWKRIEGGPGKPYTVTGQAGSDALTLTSRAYNGMQITGKDGAQAWLQTNRPKATVQSVLEEARSSGPTYTIAYVDRDADGNQRSALTTIINASGSSIVVLTLQTASGTRNLLEAKDVAPEVGQIRASFFTLPTGQAAPAPTSTPVPVG